MNAQDRLRLDQLDYEQRERQWTVDIAPLKFADATMDTLVDPPSVRATIEGWVSRLQRWDSGYHGPNLVLTGPTGTGKSWAAAAVGRHLHVTGMTERGWDDEWQVPVSVGWVGVTELMAAARPGGDHRVIDDALYAGVLVLDDVGNVKPSEFALEVVFRVVGWREAHARSTIVTTNLDVMGSPSTFEEQWGEPVFSRVARGADIVRMTGPDRRSAALDERWPIGGNERKLSTVTRLPTERMSAAPNESNGRVESAEEMFGTEG